MLQKPMIKPGWMQSCMYYKTEESKQNYGRKTRQGQEATRPAQEAKISLLPET